MLSRTGEKKQKCLRCGRGNFDPFLLLGCSKEYEKPLIPTIMTNELFNRIVMLLYKKTTSITPGIINYNIKDSGLNIMEMEQELTQIGILLVKHGKYNMYSLTHQARKAIDTMSDEYYNRPYEFFLDKRPMAQPNKEQATQRAAIFKKGTVKKILSNPWVITIVGGLILAALAKLFGLI